MKPQNVWSDSASESSATLEDEVDSFRDLHVKVSNAFGDAAEPNKPSPVHRNKSPTKATPEEPKFVPAFSYALVGEQEAVKTNTGNTRLVMALLSEMWIIHIAIILGCTFCMTFLIPQGYVDDELWNVACWWRLGFLLPLPYTLVCFFGLALPFRTPKFLYTPDMKKRRVDNLYILTVTRGNNREVNEKENMPNLVYLGRLSCMGCSQAFGKTTSLHSCSRIDR
jgi:hypothetical protein